jgi:hypothetical protein
VPADVTPVVFNSWVLQYFDAALLRRHVDSMLGLVAGRGAVWISAEDPTRSRTWWPDKPASAADGRCPTRRPGRSRAPTATAASPGTLAGDLACPWPAGCFTKAEAGAVVDNPRIDLQPSPSPMFEHIEPFAGDPILSLNEDFQKDPRPHKINLSIGIYFDDEGRIPVLDCVRKAEAQLLEKGGAKPYLPIEGNADFRRAVQTLLFGAGSKAVADGRVATLQTVGSSSALKVGADFIKRWFPDSGVWVSDPTWDNHRSMFEGAGIKVSTYPYYDAATGGLKFDAMLRRCPTCPRAASCCCTPAATTRPAST